MRRKDREVTDLQEIFDILLRCDTVRIGMTGPYIVPVSFGAEIVDGKVVIYPYGKCPFYKSAVVQAEEKKMVYTRLVRLERMDLIEKYGLQ